MNFRWRFLILGTALLVACGGTPQKPVDAPDWVSGQSARHAPELYITGRGQSKSLDDAKDRARADLAKTFEVSIQETQKDVQVFSSAQSGDKPAKTQSQLNVTRTIVTTTDQIVRGVQIGDVWRNPVTLEHYALAILPRQQAAEMLRQEIGRLDENTRVIIDTAANSVDPLIKIAQARRALDAQIDRLAFNRSLQVVNRSGDSVRTVWNIASLQSDFEKLLTRTRIRPVITNDDTGTFKSTLAGNVAAAGFTVDESSDADFILEASLALEDLGQKSDGWWWSQGALELKLVDKSGKARGNKRWPIKVSAQQKAVVAQRAMDDVAKLLNKELRATLIGFATGS